jgi:FMN phosphatase YigB (HAD superfamily)
VNLVPLIYIVLIIGGNMPIKVVMFDVGGVLVRTENQNPRKAWEEKLGLPGGELSRLVFDNELAMQATLGHATEDLVWDWVRKELHLTTSDLNRLKIDFWAGDVLDLKLIEYLKRLRPQVTTALLSNAWTGARQLFVEKFHLDLAVDIIFISAELKLAKPSPEIYQVVIEKLGVKPEEIVFVDDFIANINAARVTGINAIHFKSYEDVRDLLDGLLEL